MKMSQEIRDYLIHNKMVILDDKYCRDGYNRKVSIPKYLKLMDQMDLLKKYEKDRGGYIKSQDCYIVISRHPYDIIGMSTDRGWKTCLNIRSDENIYGSKYVNIIEDLLNDGSIISYLVKVDDKEIKNPISRILIENTDEYGQNPLYKADGKIYGTNIPEYKEKVEELVSEINSKIV